MIPFSGDTSLQQEKTLTELISKIFRKEIVKPPPLFEENMDIQNHINELEKYMQLALISNADERVIILLESLSLDIKDEINMINGFLENRNNYNWIKEELIKKYSKKKSKTTPIIEMLNLKQASDQSLADFIKVIRITANKKINHLNTSEREKIMLDTLYNGLKNSNIAVAAKSLNLKTLDEVYESIKHEAKSDNKECYVINNNEQSNGIPMALLQRKIETLERRIKYLENNGNYNNYFPGRQRVQEQQH